MTPELTALTLAALVQVIQYPLYAVPANLDLGVDYTAGPRDHAPSRELSPLAGRLKRAMDNHFEGLALFSIAALVIAVSGQSTWLTATCAWAYLGARIFYIPAYAFGLRPWRTAIWGVGFLATILMLIAALI